MTAIIEKKVAVITTLKVRFPDGKIRNINLLLDTKAEKIGFSFVDKELNVRFSVKEKLSNYIESLQGQIEAEKAKGKTAKN